MIHKRGYWMDRAETDTHRFDFPLCRAIVEMYSDYDSIVDIGCGNGAYTYEFVKAGFICEGYDGSPLTPEISNGLCKIKDFSKPVDIGRFDLVVSLEVGEHIPQDYEEIFINNLVRACGREMVISWAIENQPGTGHVNCQNNGYIINKMKDKGLDYDEEKSMKLRQAAELPWFANTIMVFKW